jgi:hypothetical protein
MKYFATSTFLLLFIAFNLSGCGQECYSTPLQLKAKYERCSDLGVSYSGKIKKNVWTFVCTTSGGDKYADFIVKDGQYCRTYQHDY